MFMGIVLIGIGIGIILIVGYLIIAQIRPALSNGMNETQITILGGFALITLEMIVLARFGLVNISF